MLDQIKASSLSAFEAWEQGVKKLNFGETTEDIKKQIAVYRELAAATDDVVLSTKYLNQAKQLQEALDPADTALRKFAESIQNTTNPANAAAKELSELDKALAAGYISWDTYGIAVENAMAKLSDTGKMEETKDLIDEMGVAIGTALSNSVGELADVFLEADASFSKFAENFLKSIAKMIIQLMLLKTIQATLGGTSLGGFLGLKANANGNSYDDGTGLKHGVYDKPTFFAFAKGGTFGGRSRLGVMGEAGPEAILPLKRGANGQLGVQAGSMAAPETTINVINNNANQNEVTVSESENSDGSRQIDIMITQKVKELFNTGAMDKTMSSNFGARRLGY
jgi:lambda family phage tail tape measure protein